jgi:hypothetical protein
LPEYLRMYQVLTVKRTCGPDDHVCETMVETEFRLQPVEVNASGLVKALSEVFIPSEMTNIITINAQLQVLCTSHSHSLNLEKLRDLIEVGYYWFRGVRMGGFDQFSHFWQVQKSSRWRTNMSGPHLKSHSKFSPMRVHVY